MKKLLLLLLFPLLATAQLPTPADSLLRADTSYALLRHDTYQIVYSHARNGPLLCQWVLTMRDISPESRYPGPFYPDTLLPKGWYRVRDIDYARSGFDKGHEVDSKDRTDSHAHNVSTFSTANIVPQTPELNRVTWLGLESYCRELAEWGDTLLIVAGVSGNIGSLVHGIVIPEYCWKTVTVLGGPDAGVPTLYVLMPNVNSIGKDWRKYIVSGGKLRGLTGLKL